MKLLRVVASNFKNCCDNFTIDFIVKSKKTSEDKEYELQAVADELYVFNTVAFVGKNASGKTTAVDLLDCCYSILGDFCLENKHYSYDGIKLELTFYHEGVIYRYRTELAASTTLNNKASFVNQTLEKKKYYKSKASMRTMILNRYPTLALFRKIPPSSSLSSRKKRHAQSILTAMERVPTPIS